MKRSAMKRKPRPRKQPDEVERMVAFKAAAEAQGCCASCGSTGPAHAHHAPDRQAIVRERGDPWTPAAAVRLCVACHEAHHARTCPVALAALPGDAVMFACELLGAEAGMAWLERRYTTAALGGTDERG